MQTSTKLHVKVSDNLVPAVNLPKSPAKRITDSYLNKSQLEYWHDAAPMAFDNEFQNQYIAALHHAFAEHYGFILNPDDIWLLILQGLSIHINQNPEKYHDTLVDFQGKKEIVVRHDGLVKGGPNNTWTEVFPVFEKAIKSSIKDGSIVEHIIPNFSTTTDIDITCAQITLMDITKNYFSYVVFTKCGIPVVYIDGEKQDWLILLGKVRSLLPTFGLDIWAEKLSDIVCRIIAVYDGKEDTGFFKDIYKYKSMSGGDTVSGWITNFFPYIIERKSQNKGGKYEVIEKFVPAGEYFSSSNFPSSVCSVPFVWKYYAETFDMNFFAGFCGFDESEMEAIRPRKNFFIGYK